jgi:hypothetical protein
MKPRVFFVLAVGCCFFLPLEEVSSRAADEPKPTPENTISIQLAAPVKPQTFPRPVKFLVHDVIDRTGDPDPMLLYKTPSISFFGREYGVRGVYFDREPKIIVSQALEDSLRAAGMLAPDEAAADYLLTVNLFSFGVAGSEAGLYAKVELNVEVKNPRAGRSEQVTALGTGFQPARVKKEKKKPSWMTKMEATLRVARGGGHSCSALYAKLKSRPCGQYSSHFDVLAPWC